MSGYVAAGFDNYQGMHVVPFYLIFDVSFSMTREIEALNKAIRSLPGLLEAADLRMADLISFSIISFSDRAQVVMPLCPLYQADIPVVKAESGTNYGAAFKLLDRVVSEDRRQLKAAGVARVFRPRIFFLADGDPSDSGWHEAFIRTMGALTPVGRPKDEPVFVPFGVRNASSDVISRLAYPHDGGVWYHSNNVDVNSDIARFPEIIVTMMEGARYEVQEEYVADRDVHPGGLVVPLPDSDMPAMSSFVPDYLSAAGEAEAVIPARERSAGAAASRPSAPEPEVIVAEISGQPGEYHVTVRSSAGETTQIPTRFPFGDPTLQHLCVAAELALMRTHAAARRIATSNEEAVQELGGALFDLLFPLDARANLRAARDQAAREGRPIQVQLRIRPPELAALPWEFIYDSSRDDYLCLSTQLVRYMELPEPVRPLTVAGPLRILGMASLPSALGNLDVELEKQRVHQALSAQEDAGRIQLHWVRGQTWRDLQDALDEDSYHIFHFIGHGGYESVTREGFLALTGDYGDSYQLTATNLGLLLADNKSLRLVTLNSCDTAKASASDVFSSTSAVLMRKGIPAVVAMQYPVSDPAAISFARGLYGAVARRLPVDQAVTRARKDVKLSHPGTLEWATAVLYLRSANPRIFDPQS